MTEPKFLPKPGQVDYTNIRYAPVVNIVVSDGQKVFLVQRSSEMRLYPNYWNGISGFLDDTKSIEEKVHEELREELGVGTADVESLKIGQVLLQEAPEYHKTWLVVPVLVLLKTRDFELDWEVQGGQWFAPSEIGDVALLPGFKEVIEQFI